MKTKTFKYGYLLLGIVLICIAIISLNTVSKVDDTPWYYTISQDEDLASKLVSYNGNSEVYDNGIIFHAGEGEKMVFANISLQEGDIISVSFDALTYSDSTVAIHIDLSEEGYDYNTEERSFNIISGELNTYSCELPYYRTDHPDNCNLRIFMYDNVDVVLSNIQINKQVIIHDNNPLVKKVCFCFRIVFAIGLVLFIYSIFTLIIAVKTGGFAPVGAKIDKKRVLFGCLGLVIITLVLAFLYRFANIKYPLVFVGSDEMGVYYLVKTICENGLSLFNPYEGGISGADLFDYPFSDLYSFIAVRIIGLFFDNPYLITNIFYFSCFYMIFLSSYYVFGKLSIDEAASCACSVLYAFTPFIQGRYLHMWLIPFFTLPLATYIAIDIINGKNYLKGDYYEKNHFYNMIFLSYLCAFTGMYYAYFTCALIAVAIVISLVNSSKGDRRKCFYPIIYIIANIMGIITNIIPNVVYWMLHGGNNYGDLARRSGSEAENYALKFVQLLLPRIQHRIPVLAAITDRYNSTYPLVNENATASLGIIASIGLIISLLILFFRKDSKIKILSYLNISTILIATVGGVSSFISVFFQIPVRCYNRMSLIIMFLSLLTIGYCFDGIKKKLHIAAYLCVLVIILGIGLYDQTITYDLPDYTNYEACAHIIDQIEELEDEDSYIFEFPYDDWPTSSGFTYKNHICYLESDKLHWSYGSMQGREEGIWQQSLSRNTTDDMIYLLRSSGYDGIYFDSALYSSLYDVEKTATFYEELTQRLNEPDLISDDGTIYYWHIDD